MTFDELELRPCRRKVSHEFRPSIIIRIVLLLYLLRITACPNLAYSCGAYEQLQEPYADICSVRFSFFVFLLVLKQL